MIWGVQTDGILPVPNSIGELIRESYEALKRTKGLDDATVIFVGGTPVGSVGSVNLIQKWTASLPPVVPSV